LATVFLIVGDDQMPLVAAKPQRRSGR